MRPINLLILSTVALAVIFFANTSGYEISFDTNGVVQDEIFNQNPETREKRQIENFDDYSSAASNQDGQEEPSFWDRVVKVALKLFSKFVEWLNSS